MKTKTRLYGSTIFALFLCYAGVSTSSLAHAPADPLHSTPIETVASRSAYPANIHVEKTAQGIEVSGLVKRRDHKNKKLRGHVDVELIDANGSVFYAVRNVSLAAKAGSSKHDHQRAFTATLSVPAQTNYGVRVRHSVGTADHQ